MQSISWLMSHFAHAIQKLSKHSILTMFEYTSFMRHYSKCFRNTKVNIISQNDPFDQFWSIIGDNATSRCYKSAFWFHILIEVKLAHHFLSLLVTLLSLIPTTFVACDKSGGNYRRLVAEPSSPSMIRVMSIKKFWYSLPKFIAQPHELSFMSEMM